MKQRRFGKIKTALLVLVAYVFAMFQGGFASWFLFYSSLVFLVYEICAYFLMFHALEVTREVDRARLQEGEDVIVTVRLRRRFWFPLGWNMVTEPLPDRLAGVYEPHRQLIFPWFKKETSFKYVIPSLPRGHYRMSECVISGGDFFGFIERKISMPLANDFLVYPSYQEMTHWALGDGSFSGTVHIAHRRSDDVAAVRGVREYHRGDRLSQIHWRASARGTGLKTKEFEHQAMNQVLFFLDVEKEHYREQSTQLFEAAVKLTASLVAYANRNLYHYGLAYKQRERVVIQPACSHTQFIRVFDHLARVMPEGTDSFSRMLGREALEQPPGVTLVLVTPKIDKEMIARLLHLSQKGRHIHLLRITAAAIPTPEEKQAMQMLAAGKVTCKTVHLNEMLDAGRIGGVS
ncbi:DUF58 domain-containing protein [Brevibacillus composti]|uniref:DUF58 domain-containing protein n=1 Tax=Brevibacillus composti TaxID=2796470 RepID=A0A7T5ELN4_9BACL|nr:DUF58 domain-containing protein [Brevibacillus composti]QQE74905.1 DUF58 domain-containing protein [Brevibacillus composti]QUO41990.1 DUF58 domain-containing protein [Brevibacillus composti]